METKNDSSGIRIFARNDKLRNLVFAYPHLLPVLSRFGIALGFGESTVEDVCRRSEVDVDTFLTVCNFFTNNRNTKLHIDVKALVKYLKSAHRYFIDYVLPGIRNKLISAISTGLDSDLSWIFIKFYDEYVDEVRRHMSYEEEKVFTYVFDLLEGKRQDNFSIEDFSEIHLPIADKLRDMKELFVGHFTADNTRVDMLNSVLFDIMMCERDLMLHCSLEDSIFVPAVRELENRLTDDNATSADENAADTNKPVSGLDDHGDILLTTRERDIVRAIAQGYSNKEIADRLFLSVHTVTTHRRNISAKLNIHSASGLTIYALMHNIITLDECAPQ